MFFESYFLSIVFSLCSLFCCFGVLNRFQCFSSFAFYPLFFRILFFRRIESFSDVLIVLPFICCFFALLVILIFYFFYFARYPVFSNRFLRFAHYSYVFLYILLWCDAPR